MEIIFAGGSHYDIGGYRSIMEYFDKVYLIKDNPPAVLNMKRYQDEIIDTFDSVDCKYIFLCGYARFITEDELSRKTYINIHGALLPKYRGMHPTFYAIMNGEEELGITFHLVNKYMDSGDILAQYKFKYENQEVSQINIQIDDLVEAYAGFVCSKFINGEIVPTPQNEEQAIFGARRNLDDCLIDYHMSNKMLRRFFKALTPSYPLPMINIRGECYEVLGNYKIIDREYFGPIGRAVNISNDGVWIKVKDGFLIVNTLRKFTTKEIVNASDIIPIGFRFP